MRAMGGAALVAGLCLVSCDAHMQAANHFDKAAKLVTTGAWASSLEEFEKGCALAGSDADKEECHKKETAIYAGHPTDENAPPPAPPAPPPPAASSAAVAVAPAPGPTAAAPTSSKLVAGTPQPTAYAVVIGVEHYDGLPSPTGARGDAEKFGALMKTTLGIVDAHQRVALDEKATKGAIERDIEWARSSVPKGGRLYFYFSGHGAPEPSSGTSYLLPSDGDPKFLKQSALLLS